MKISPVPLRTRNTIIVSASANRVENTYSTMSALDGGANRSLGVVDCEDEFTTTVARFDGAQSAARLQVRLMITAATTAAATLVDSPVLEAPEHTLEEIA
jgi:hypothetical protein